MLGSHVRMYWSYIDKYFTVALNGESAELVIA